eukprot:Rmarinus@m.8426
MSFPRLKSLNPETKTSKKPLSSEVFFPRINSRITSHGISDYCPQGSGFVSYGNFCIQRRASTSHHAESSEKKSFRRFSPSREALSPVQNRRSSSAPDQGGNGVAAWDGEKSEKCTGILSPLLVATRSGGAHENMQLATRVRRPSALERAIVGMSRKTKSYLRTIAGVQAVDEAPYRSFRNVARSLLLAQRFLKIIGQRIHRRELMAIEILETYIDDLASTDIIPQLVVESLLGPDIGPTSWVQMVAYISLQNVMDEVVKDLCYNAARETFGAMVNQYMRGKRGLVVGEMALALDVFYDLLRDVVQDVALVALDFVIEEHLNDRYCSILLQNVTDAMLPKIVLEAFWEHYEDVLVDLLLNEVVKDITTEISAAEVTESQYSRTKAQRDHGMQSALSHLERVADHTLLSIVGGVMATRGQSIDLLNWCEYAMNDVLGHILINSCSDLKSRSNTVLRNRVSVSFQTWMCREIALELSLSNLDRNLRQTTESTRMQKGSVGGERNRSDNGEYVCGTFVGPKILHSLSDSELGLNNVSGPFSELLKNGM